MMRSTNTAADALDTVPEYGELLQICAFDEEVTQTLVFSDTTGLNIGDSLAGDTSSATGTVSIINGTSVTVTGKSVADFQAEDLNTGAYTVTAVGDSVLYTNSQTPIRGSGVGYVDGKKYTATDSIVGDASFTFEVGKSASISAALQGFLDNNGVPTNEANPDVTLNDEPVMIVSCADVLTAGGSTVQADMITIEMGADIQELYGIGGLKEFNINDYVIKMTADFYVDSADYDNAITKLNNETVEAINIKLGTNQTGELINGKSVYIVADFGKANTFSDSSSEGKVKRSFTWLLRPDANDHNLKILHGYFAPAA